MSVNLNDYQEWLDELTPESLSLFKHSWTEATRVLSARGLDNYIKGASALQGLGKGHQLVDAWLEAAPLVAKEVGEDVLSDLVTNTLSLASKTSGSVIELVLSTAPIAATRLADGELFLQYLQVVTSLINVAPRAVRPMLDNLEVLLKQLTLGGLRRWSNWGAQAHRTNYVEQVNYFSLASKESLAILQKERKGTLLVDVQRRINMYLRALWGRDFYMRPTSGDFETREGYKPYIEDYLIHLPDALDGVEGQHATVTATELYRATAAHAAAHLVYTRQPISAEALNPWQMAIIGLIEDARIEFLACQKFPGLQHLWGNLHTIAATQANTAGDYMNRLARALIDSDFQDPCPWVNHGRNLFDAAKNNISANPFDNRISWDIGVELAHRYKGTGPVFQARTDNLAAVYRDDNRYFWAFEEFDFERSTAAGYHEPAQIRKHVSLMEFVNEIDVETAGDDAQEIWVLGTELMPYEDMGVSFNESEGKEPLAEPCHYAEWDYLIQLERPAWATVQERRPKLGDLSMVDAITAAHRRLIGRMKFLLDAMQPQGVQRIRKLEDGDDIDLNAALDSVIQKRMGQQPDPRIMMRSIRKTRDISVMVLLDLSQSTNDKVNDQDHTVLELTQQACVLLADAIAKVGDAFAIHGFCSDGRHDVHYYRFKDFNQAYDDLAKARIAGMTGQLSTRMGAAIRHSTADLMQRKSAKKLMLVITDGEPADVDVRDPQYLRYDTKKAVEEAARHGISTFCMSLDPRADQYVSRIFGAQNFMVVDKVERLPEKLPMLYASLTR